MKLSSEGWTNGDRIPDRYAAARRSGAEVVLSDNLSPPFAWSDVPKGAKSLVLICHDFDVPSRRDDVNKTDREVPSDLPRIDFFHWVLVDLPPSLAGIAEGEFGRGFVAGGKPGPAAAHGARTGLNDYTRFFADDAEKAGRYFAYDGPYPPFNDSLVHHYVFTLYALGLARLPVDGDFDGRRAREALDGHVIEEATFSGTYTLNRRLLG